MLWEWEVDGTSSCVCPMALFSVPILNLWILYPNARYPCMYRIQIRVLCSPICGESECESTSTHVINLMDNGDGSNCHAKAPFIAFLPPLQRSPDNTCLLRTAVTLHSIIVSLLPHSSSLVPQPAFSSAASSFVPIHGRSGTVPWNYSEALYLHPNVTCTMSRRRAVSVCC